MLNNPNYRWIVERYIPDYNWGLKADRGDDCWEVVDKEYETADLAFAKAIWTSEMRKTVTRKVTLHLENGEWKRTWTELFFKGVKVT